MNIADANKDPTVLKFRKDVKKKKESKWKRKLRYARNHYLSMKKRGVYSVIVDEWDTFELEKLRYEENTKESGIESKTRIPRGEIIMSERKVLVRLSKAFNNVEVEVNGIESKEEFTYESEWAKAEAFNLINALPDTQLGKSTPSTPKSYTRDYTAPAASNQQATGERVVAQDITTKFLKGKQVDHALKLINKGKLSIQQVNGLQSWDEQQGLIYSDENKKVLFGK